VVRILLDIKAFFKGEPILNKHDRVRQAVILASILGVAVVTLRRWVSVYRDPEGYINKKRSNGVEADMPEMAKAVNNEIHHVSMSTLMGEGLLNDAT